MSTLDTLVILYDNGKTDRGTACYLDDEISHEDGSWAVNYA